jgi:outer membrane protein OmpA-like peptidoglycan-associated protein
MAFYVVAAAQSGHELSVYGGGGLSTLRYQPIIGSSALGMGGQLGLGYAYHFSEHWDVATGVGVTFLRASAGVNDLELITAGLRDRDGDLFDLYTTLSGHNEVQQATYFNVPLQLRFSTGRFYARAGVSVGVPLAASYRTTSFSAVNRGYYTDMGSWGASQNEALGFGTYPSTTSSGALDLKVSVSASLEAGLRWMLAEKWRLYTGLYVDYGLNNINGGAAVQPFVSYNPQQPAVPSVNSVLASTSQTASVNSRRLVDKIAPLAVGVKVGLAFACSRSAKVAPAPLEPAEATHTDALPATVEEQPEAEAPQKATVEEQPEAEVSQEAATEEQLKAETSQEADDEQRLAAQQQTEQQQRLYAAATAKVEQPIDGYAKNIANLSAAMEAELDKKVKLLKRYPDKNVIVEGHTCNLGTHEVNLIVGLRRAEAVKKYLIYKGIVPECITAITKAETEPAVPNTSEANRRKNRRVKIIME